MRVFWRAFALLLGGVVALSLARGGPAGQRPACPLRAPRPAPWERPCVVRLTASGRAYFTHHVVDLTSPSADDREEATEALLDAFRATSAACVPDFTEPRAPCVCVVCDPGTAPAHIAGVWEAAGLVHPPTSNIQSVVRRPAPDREE